MNTCDNCANNQKGHWYEQCNSCYGKSNWKSDDLPNVTTSKEIHDKLHVLYSQYNDLGEALSRIDDLDNPYTYELIQAKFNALAQEIESVSKKEWREA
jgi:hypothetical protein